MNPNTLIVKEKTQISVNLLRITFYGEELNENVTWKPGAYIKLMIPSIKTTLVRSYTVRHFSSTARTLSIDFALHQSASPGTNWALKAKKGDNISYKGIGLLKTNPEKGDWYIFSADLSALPAALSIMESLKDNARGYALLEVTDKQDEQALNIPKGIEVQWLIHPNPTDKSTQQLEALKKIEHLEGEPNLFVAGELSTIREIKQYISKTAPFSNATTYISSYWKIGLHSDEHKLAKKAVL